MFIILTPAASYKSLLDINLPNLDISAVQLWYFNPQDTILQLRSDAISINVCRCSSGTKTNLPLEGSNLPLAHSKRPQEILITRTVDDTSD